jgi:omega-6 fatty acid desaturase (delta-12 desaturase)
MTTEKSQWQKIAACYAQPDLKKSVWQALNTLIPYLTLFYLSMRSLEISFWLTLPLTLLTAGFMVRTFIIFHDCGHGSLF